MPDIKTTELLKSSVKDGKVENTIEDYLKRFESDVPAESRLKSASEMNQKFYSLVTDFYLHAWGRMFHFGMRKKGERFKDSLIRHEYYLGDKLALNAGEKCLDIGCGVAGPMINIAKKYKARITGINNSAYQLKKAGKFLQHEGLEHLCSIVECDWMNIPLADGSYDKAYAIEASVHAADRRKDLFSEINRLLKPGALLAGYDWVMKENYNPENAAHRSIKHDIEMGNGISNLNFADDVKKALEQAGFEIIECRDMAQECDPETPWYLPLKGEGYSLKMLRISPAGRFFMKNLFRLLETARILPKGTLQVSKLLNVAGEGLIKGGEEGIFTPMLFFLARKI